MTTTLLAISAAYVVMGVLLLSMGLTARLSWWVKAAAIIVTSFFFVEVFFSTRGLLGWPGSGVLPPKFQLLWSRVVEPDPKASDPGAIFLWVEELDENNVPSGLPRSYRLKYSQKLADRSNKARDEIVAGHPQEGLAEDMESEGNPSTSQDRNLPQMDGGSQSPGGQIELTDALKDIPHVEFRPMSGPLMLPKP